MIFNRIILYNFRQFKDRVDIDLISNDKNRNIVVFLGDNGAGKTTFAQSLRYCMFGSRSNYLRLSRIDELINNTIVHEIGELDQVGMFVEVHFEKSGIKYIAKRSATFQKQKGKLVQINEKFLLTQSTATGGYVAISSESEALNLMYKMMPPGLAYLYLFDGERLEDNISKGTSLKEVQETIRGFLNLKRYELLIEKIGSSGKAKTLINALENSISFTPGEEQNIKDAYQKLVEELSDLEENTESINDRITQIKQFIDQHKDDQNKQLEISEHRIRLSRFEAEVDKLDQQINYKSELLNKKSNSALLSIALNSVKSKYDSVLRDFDKQQKKYYKSLHVDTLNQVLDEEMCICGTKVQKESLLHERILSLFETALPNDYTSNIDSINQYFSASSELAEEREVLKNDHSEIINLKYEKRELLSEIDSISQLIRNIEKQINHENQSKIDEYNDEKDVLIAEYTKLNQVIKQKNETLERLQPKYNEIIEKNDASQSITKMIGLLNEESLKLREVLFEKDQLARNLLASNFDRFLSQVLPEKYEISIDEKYRFKLEQVVDSEKGLRVDSTEELSKGQSAVLSMVFLRSLLETSKEMSDLVQDDNGYGIVMDASMATLDSKNVHRLATKIVSDFDQLLFLSVDRQLRDEMFEGIRDRINKVFVIETKENKGTILPIGIVDLEERLSKKRD